MAAAVSAESPFSIIIDGGSTGSRLHIFEFVNKAGNVECLRRGSARANGALSSFARLPDQLDEPVDTQAVADHLMPAFTHAAKTIPQAYHNNTRVWYAATAGMRLLTETEQDAIYDAVYEGLLKQSDFVFRGMRRGDIGTLSGELEGFYGAVAANYLKGTINANLEMDHMGSSTINAETSSGVIGALDMGGASTQIVFLPGKGPAEQEQTCAVDENKDCGEQQVTPQRMNGNDFFSTSYLSYGVDQFRERLWDTWIEEHKLENSEGDACTSEVLENPCSFRGYMTEWEGYTLVGTGSAQECIRQVQRLIPHATEEVVENLGTHVGGVEHPPVHGKFFAMSLYFFALDSLRELSTNNKEAYEALNLSWPNPSIQELYNALDGLCGRAWHGDLEDIQHSAHAFTRAEVLPHRCIESVYMVTLLRDGFGFSPESRDITFTFLVDGSEVEWSLGMALSLRLEEQEGALDDSDMDSPKSNVTRKPLLGKDEEKQLREWKLNETHAEVDQLSSTMS